ncbi:Plant UBX domain-containing protein 2 [Striga hermonthica]|uniref:Plant UBX domain-containing protein 2 n=1 Tax=Striga hermonthica TaxID=68872 RepID=A0A9N7RQB0_STRHE|nr:Plant UBX domain-containing protein 2 [Striga hermonthica]
MDGVRDKMKGLMNKINNPFSNSPSAKFKGQGRVLGSSSSSSATQYHHPLSSPSSMVNHKPFAGKPPAPKVSDNIAPQQKLQFRNPEKPANSEKFAPQQKSQFRNPEKPANWEKRDMSENGFDPFSPLITSSRRNPNGYSLQVFECPVCGKAYTSEKQIYLHIDSCLNAADFGNEFDTKESEEIMSQLETSVGSYVSGKPSDGSKEIMLILLKNVVKDPANAKFRKIRIGNPKIKEAVGDVPGGIELLLCVGFDLIEENGEMWLVMDDPCSERLRLAKAVISLLETNKVKELPQIVPAKIEEEPVEPKHVDRQIRVFSAVHESVAAKIELPDSFYDFTAEELKRETDARKTNLEESKLLFPKSYKEKQATAGKKLYKKTVIRVQFPDGVVLQAIFSPSESTGALYEFVSNALKDSSTEFSLQHPDLVERRLIPRFPANTGKAPTLEDEDLVPAAFVKFRPVETDEIVFTGLRNELVVISEPLVSGSAVPSS